MKWRDNLLSALVNISLAKTRSMLTILGILIGTASVVALLLSGQLASEHALAQFKVLGTNLLSIQIQQDSSSSTHDSSHLSITQALASQSADSDLLVVAPYVTNYSNITFDDQNLNAVTIGATESLQPILKIQLYSGRFISSLDKEQNYTVIGYQVFQQLKQQGILNPIGKQMPINNVVFTIVGVLQPWAQNSFFSENIDNSVIIPLQTLLSLNPHQQINNVVYQFQGTQIDLSKVQNQLTRYFQAYFPHATLFIRSPQQMIASMEEQSKTFTLLLGVIGCISLIVGGIGVMNMMLVSVMQRRLEIGIRRAVGARQSDILELFLFESVVLSLLGGIFGIVIGIVTAYIISLSAHWSFHVYWFPPTIGFLVSTLVGIVCGFYPATKAAKLNPILILHG
jgi:putative ABC transport system permease protein